MGETECEFGGGGSVAPDNRQRSEESRLTAPTSRPHQCWESLIPHPGRSKIRSIIKYDLDLSRLKLPRIKAPHLTSHNNSLARSNGKILFNPSRVLPNTDAPTTEGVGYESAAAAVRRRAIHL